MAASSAVKGLPVHDIHLRILDYIVADCQTWEDSRKYLHLRLLSKSLGSHFEAALFCDIRLQVAGLSAKSTQELKHLLHIIKSVTQLAGRVKSLSIEDDCERQDGSDAQKEGRQASPVGETPPAAEEQTAHEEHTDREIAALVELCTRLEVLDLQATRPETGAEPIFTKQIAQSHQNLHLVILRDDALLRHILHYLSAGLSGTSLEVTVGRGELDVPFDEENLFAYTGLMMAVGRIKVRPIRLDTVNLSQSGYRHLWMLGGQRKIKARLIRLGITPSYAEI